MRKIHLKYKTMIFPECIQSTARSITCTNKSMDNYEILKDSKFTSSKLVNQCLKLEKKS